jgi:uncharacterized protein (TIGR03790 family)
MFGETLKIPSYDDIITRMIIRIILALFAFSPLVFSQTAENVLLVLNEASPTSLEVGTYYAQKRGIPRTNILRIKTTTADEISREDFERQIDAPIASQLTIDFAQDRILYIVLTKGIPLRISGSSGQDGTTACVDSELTLLYRKLLKDPGLRIPGRIANPYFLNETPLAKAKKFSHADQDIYLVSRLDGFNSADIRGLIDRGFAPSKEGKILLDMKGSPTQKGDSWLQQAADLLATMGFKDRIILDSTDKILTGEKQVLGYYSWGSNDPAIHIRHFGLEFVPGALAGMFVSSDGRTFSEPPANWNVSRSWSDKNALFSGSPQSLAGDLIHDGITGIAGHVTEPYLETTIRPNILFPAYVSGFNLIESFYLAMPSISWQTVVVGDPLCAPFRASSLTANEIDKGIDPDTELPSAFSERRLGIYSKTTSQPGVQLDAVKMVLRAESRLIKKDQEGAKQALEKVIALDKRLTAPQLLLATLYESAHEYDKALERYRQLHEIAPDNALVLNNLAYVLGIRKNNIQEALPLAEKAHSLAKNPATSDTLGWIYHLAGQNDKAVKLLEEAAKAMPTSSDVQLHFAVVSAEIGNMTAAESALKRALAIDPKLEQSEDVKKIRAKLK